MTYRTEDAEYLIVGQGSVVPSAEVVADYLRETRKLKIGVVDMAMFRPFPADLVGRVLKGRKGVVVLERLDQPLAVDLPADAGDPGHPLASASRTGATRRRSPTRSWSLPREDIPALYSGAFGLGSRDLQPEGIIGAVENMLPTGPQKKMFYLSIDFLHDKPFTPKQELYQQTIAGPIPR
jgi:pyruvate-ferredoxin/flavodoxin oxidoreductase